MSEKSFPAGRWIAALLAITGLIAVFYNVVVDNMPKGEVRNVEGYTPWSQEILELAETLPVQDGGRIKPLSTFAGFTMLGLHGARSMEISDDAGKVHRIKPTAWMMDLLFRPALSVQQPTFRIDNSSALEAIGVKTLSKRDRYSYNDIESGRDKLMELAKSYQGIDSKKRDALQNQVLDLASNLRTYEILLGYFGFARSGIVLRAAGENDAKHEALNLSELMANAPKILKTIEDARGNPDAIPPGLQILLREIIDAANYSKYGLFFVPPADAANKTWHSAGNVIMDTMSGDALKPADSIETIRAIEATARAINDSAEFRKEFGTLHDRIANAAKNRGEYRGIGLEAEYYRKNWFLYALAFFLIGTISAMGMWTVGRNKAGNVFTWITLGSTLVGLCYCVIAITKRCIIMQRPPVGNLYDTIIFIAATVVLFSLIVEWLTRRRFALGIGPILGTALIVLARRYELGDAKDNMDPLVAVLDSNFWLTIHVITITLGYSAGLLSAFLSSGYVLMRGLNLDGNDKDLRRALTRAVYGMLCLTLFLSLVGTVLGGIWANYSWGRFWGWDPKENGALLIVLWMLAILHARLGGYLREWGLHLAAVFTAVVVTFSWWHVNFLGVGLHNYGFTAGKNTIWAFYGCMLAVLIFGAIAIFIERTAKTSPPPPQA